MRYLLPIVAACLGLSVLTAIASAGEETRPEPTRTWTDATGGFTTTAVLLGLRDGKVQLRNADGREITIAIEKLSASDQEYLRNRTASAERPTPRPEPIAAPAPAALTQAALKGDLATLDRFLTESPANLDRRDSKQGATPLHWAATGAEVAAVKLLLERGSDVDAKNHAGLTALHISANAGSEAIVGLLLQHGAAVAPYDSTGRSPLDLATAAGHKEVAAILTKAEDALRNQLQAIMAPPGAIWLEALESQETPQSPISASDRAWPDVQISLGGKLYRHGLWSHDRDSQYTVRLNGRGTRLSLVAGVVDSNGEHGRLRFLVSTDGRTLADTGFLVGRQPPKLLTVDIRGARQATVRVDTGGDGNWANAGLGGVLLHVNPDESLHAAALNGQTQDVERLAQANPSRVTEIDELLRMPPLWAAALGGHYPAVRILVNHGADPNQRAADGSAALHAMVMAGRHEAIERLVRAGADPRAKDKAGRTAHDLATERGDPFCVAALTDAEWWVSPLNQLTKASDFQVKDLKGSPFTRSDFEGKTTVMFFFEVMQWNKDFNYTWLAYAQTLGETPEAKAGKLVVLAATPTEPSLVLPFLKEHGYSFRVLLDPEDSIRRELGLYGLPGVVIDSEGRIVWQRRLWQRSRIEDSGLFLAVDRVLAGGLKTKSELPTADVGEQKEQVLFDFERDFGQWQKRRDCWGNEPATDAIYPGLIKGYVGRRFLSTFPDRGWTATGMAYSPTFTVTKPFLHLLVGGGDLPNHCGVALVADGIAVRRATGVNSAELRPVCWDLREFVGKKARLEVFDAGIDEPRDFILVDEVVLSDSPNTPSQYAHRFNPDDSVDAANVAQHAPPFIKAFRAGQVHVDTMPGRTFRLEWKAPIEWSSDPADWLQYAFTCPQNHVAQAVARMSCLIESNGTEYACKVVPTPSPMYPQAFCAYIPAKDLPSRKATVHYSCDMTPQIVEIVAGPPPEPPADLPAGIRASLTAPVAPFYDYAKPATAKYLDEHKLRRWPSETDAAFLFRACRFFQRYFIYGNVAWAGRPLVTQNADPSLSSLEKLTADCGLAHPLGLVLRANGIPAAAGQGGWVEENGRMGAHVRLLCFLRDVGWFWMDMGPEVAGPNGWISTGTRWDDNFLQLFFEDPAGWDSQLSAPAPGKVVRANASEWPNCRLLKKPDLVPISPCADTDSTLWRVTEREPASGWMRQGFNDQTWTEAPAGFGPPQLPYCKVRCSWTSRDIWLRRKFSLGAGQLNAPRLRVFHDEDCEVYINGELAVKLSGARSDYGLFPLSTEARRALKSGQVVFAVHCRNVNGPGGIDVGLVDVRP